jgi:hypothetical protein
MLRSQRADSPNRPFVSSMKTLLRPPLFRRLGATLLLGGLGLVLPASVSAYTYTKTVPTGTITVDGTALGIVPGDVVGLAAGERSRLVLTNIHGTAANPVIIANMGGKVRVGNDGASAAISINNCSNIRFVGDGDPAFKYGIEVHRATAGQGLQIYGGSTRFEVAFLHIHHAFYAGIMSKDDPTCVSGAPGPYNRGNFTQEDVSFHDIYIHDVGGEGFYIGSSFYGGTSEGTCGTVYPHDIEGVRLFNNITERTGREGIQVGCATIDCEIYNNFVRDPGTQNLANQNNGVQINPGTTGLFHSNTVINAPNNGVALTSLGNNAAFNNVVVGSGGHAFFADNRTGTISGSFLRVSNNTIVNAGQYAFRTYNELCATEFRNNLVVNATSGTVNTGDGATVTQSNNISQATTTGLGFVNAGIHDYRIAGASSALNAGFNLTAQGVTFDREGLARPFGAAFEIGAFEAGALSAVITAWSHPSQPGATNGTLTVSAVGGTAPYTYAWSNGATTAALTGLAGGTYTVTVTDAASTQRVRSFTLIDPSPLTVKTRILPELAGANDGSITLTPAGVAPYTIAWAHGPTTLALTGLDAGFYSYTLTDANGAYAAATLYVRDGGTPVHRVNSGGNAETDRVINWIVDKPSASPYVVSAGTLATGSATWNGSNGNPTEGPNNLFGDRRYINGAQMNWDFPVTNGSYEVQLFFNENASGFTVGSRVFDVLIEGALQLDNFDVCAVHGFEQPAQHTFWVDVTDGKVDIDFLQVTGSPMVSAIAIHSHGGGLPTGTPVFRIDAGGNAQTDPPLDWAVDKNPSTISPQLVSTGQLNTGPNTWSGSNTTGAPNNIFANYRYDPAGGSEMQWEFPLPKGSYRLNLYYMERDTTVTGPGQRLFDVAVEGTVLWTNMDPYGDFGWMVPGRESVVLDITDGKLDLDFLHVNTRAPIISGISIHRVK